MSLHYIMHALFNFPAANFSIEQSLLSFISDLYKSSDFDFISFWLWETNDISLFWRCLFVNDYLKSKDLISDENNVQNFSLAKS